MKRLLLIDGMSTAYRAFYAIRDLTTSSGEPTNAVYGFVRMVLKMLDEYRPDFVAIASDSKEPTFRHERFQAYKARRKPMPADLVRQLPLIREAAAGLRIPWLAVPGYEADDRDAEPDTQSDGAAHTRAGGDLFFSPGQRSRLVYPRAVGFRTADRRGR